MSVTIPHDTVCLLRLLYFRLPSILANRLFLNLKSYTKPEPGLTTVSRSIPGLAFAGQQRQQHDRFLGNIGAPLRTWFDDEDDDEIELEESAADETIEAALCDEETGGREVEMVPVVNCLAILSSHQDRRLVTTDILSTSLDRCTAHRERLKSYPWLWRVILPVLRRAQRKTRLIRRSMSKSTLTRRFK